ncbi:hypothetical protein CoNPh11_CDS0005 [Staphylococcus phage S-CoN_Ph11]|nr:hypothetical protein CoNPh11_CDS0005 [Staphylococcus phage S-CoN_Ph11]
MPQVISLYQPLSHNSSNSIFSMFLHCKSVIHVVIFI